MGTRTATTELDTALAGLFPAGTAVATVVIDTNREPVRPAEAATVARAIPARQAEFAAGRAAARTALRALGQPPVAIPAGANREPLWPAGVSGSIAHAAGIAVAALRHGAPLGLDIESDQQLKADLWPLICSPAELEALPAMDRGRHVARVFSAKEAAYKAQFPATGTLLGFDAMTVRLSATGFVARLMRAVGPFARGHEFHGRAAQVNGMILSGVAL